MGSPQPSVLVGGTIGFSPEKVFALEGPKRLTVASETEHARVHLWVRVRFRVRDRVRVRVGVEVGVRSGDITWPVWPWRRPLLPRGWNQWQYTEAFRSLAHSSTASATCEG